MFGGLNSPASLSLLPFLSPPPLYSSPPLPLPSVPPSLASPLWRAPASIKFYLELQMLVGEF
jgi:hypothetical protein